MTILISSIGSSTNSLELTSLVLLLVLVVGKLLILASPDGKFTYTLNQLLTLAIMPLFVVFVIKVILAFAGTP